MRPPRGIQAQPERILVRPGDIAWLFRSSGRRGHLWLDNNGYRTDGHEVPVHLVSMFVRVLRQERFEVAIEPGGRGASRGTRQPPVVVIPPATADRAPGRSSRHWMRWFEHWTHRAAIIMISTAALVILSIHLWIILVENLGYPRV